MLHVFALTGASILCIPPPSSLSHSLLSGFPLPPTPHHLVPVVKYSCRLMPLSPPEAFHNALILPAGVKTALIVTLNIHVFDNTWS